RARARRTLPGRRRRPARPAGLAGEGRPARRLAGRSGRRRGPGRRRADALRGLMMRTPVLTLVLTLIAAVAVFLSIDRTASVAGTPIGVSSPDSDRKLVTDYFTALND